MYTFLYDEDYKIENVNFLDDIFYSSSDELLEELRTLKENKVSTDLIIAYDEFSEEIITEIIQYKILNDSNIYIITSKEPGDPVMHKLVTRCQVRNVITNTEFEINNQCLFDTSYRKILRWINNADESSVIASDSNEVKTEYIVPSDYHKVCGFYGAKGTGISTIVQMISNWFISENKKVLILDNSETQSLFRKFTWGFGSDIDFKVEDEFLVYKVNKRLDIVSIYNNEKSFPEIINTFKQKYDVIMVDEIDILKQPYFLDTSYYIVDGKEEALKDANMQLKEISSNKITVIYNRVISKIDNNIITADLNDEDNKIIYSNRKNFKYFSIEYLNKEEYKTLINKPITKIDSEKIKEICFDIYPVLQEEKKSFLDGVKKLVKFK